MATEKQYRFTTKWVIDAPLEVASEIVADNTTWTLWWAGLQDARIITHTPNIVGSKIACVWRSHSGYKIRLVITITEYQHDNHIAFISEGDLEGRGEWDFVAKDQKTEMHILWDVQTKKWWMNTLAPLLRSVFVANHALLMAQGEAGLNAYLHKRLIK